MLQKLTIKNYAIIDSLVITPDTGLNIVTGETGAGKSIILGALSLILGERADTSVLINKTEKCIVEALFDVSKNDDFKNAIITHELDNDDQCIIRREIGANGKSRAFINDTPVKLNTLNTLTSLLVDLHQQFDHLAMDNNSFQIEVLDAIAGNGALRNKYNSKFANYTNITTQLQTLLTQQANWQKEADYKQFIYSELQEADLKIDEIEEAEQELKKLSNAENITNILQEVVGNLKEGEQPIVSQLKRVAQQLQTIVDTLPELRETQKRIDSAHIELADIVGELESLSANIYIDEEQITQLQDKVDIGYKLLKKHGVKTTNELIAIQQNLENDLQHSLNIEQEISRVEQAQNKALQELLAIAHQLSDKRKNKAKSFEKEVNKLLTLVGMPNAVFSVDLTTQPTPDKYGLDKLQFLLDANKNGQPQPVHKAASGGEMSRIMLCIKSLTAQAIHLPTLIFDEVDTGISGEAAKQVALLLKKLAQYHQIICITHQPQVAAKGSSHLYVYKEEDKNGRITTRVSTLTDKERITTIAKMIGGEKHGNAALQNAKELMAE